MTGVQTCALPISISLQNGCYDTKLAVQGEDGGNWQFERGIGLKRRRRALGVAAAMLGRVEGVIALIEGGVYDSCSEEAEPVSIEDVLDNTEMVQDTSTLFFAITAAPECRY